MTDRQRAAGAAQPRNAGISEGMSAVQAGNHKTGRPTRMLGRDWWTEERDALLRQQWRALEPIQAIAEDLGVSVSTVSGRAQQLNLPSRNRRSGSDRPVARPADGATLGSSTRRAGRPWTDNDDRLLRQWWEWNELVTDIAKQMKRTTGEVRERVVELALPQRVKPAPSARDAGGKPCAYKHLAEHREPSTGTRPLIVCGQLSDQQYCRAHRALILSPMRGILGHGLYGDGRVR